MNAMQMGRSRYQKLEEAPEEHDPGLFGNHPSM